MQPLTLEFEKGFLLQTNTVEFTLLPLQPKVFQVKNLGFSFFFVTENLSIFRLYWKKRPI